MLRAVLVLAGAAAIGLAAAQIVWAQEPAPELAPQVQPGLAPDAPADASAGEGVTSLVWPETGQFTRGTGYYLDPWKLLLMWLVFLSWVQSSDWISRDAQAVKLRWAIWNPIVFFSFMLGLLLFWAIPNFFVGMFFLLAAYVAPLATYVTYRNKQMCASSDMVLTGKHLQRWFARKMNTIGIKMAEEDPREQGPDVKYTAMGADGRDNSANQLTARRSEGYMPSRELVDDALKQRATHVMLDYTPQSVGVRYQIDGVWHDRSSLERAVGDPILETLKTLSALNPKDRRNRQSGQFGLQFTGGKFTAKITSQGTQTGERALLQFDPAKLPTLSLDDLGMREKMQQQLLEMMSQHGLFIFSSMPGGGLTTTIDQVLSNCDRFTRNFVEVVDEDKPQKDIENVHLTTYSAAAGETPATVLPKLIRTYPEVIIVRDVAELETLSILCEQAGEDRLIITSTRAKEAVEALLRIMMLKIPPAEFAAAVMGVLNVRLVRKLCEKCKEAYAPPPEVLRQLGLPAGKIEALYRTPTQPINPKKPDEVCDQCNGIGYLGRTGIFELLVINDHIRKVLTTAPKLENLRTIARKLKHRGCRKRAFCW